MAAFDGLFASDADVACIAKGDFTDIVPITMSMCHATDGVIQFAARWTMTSAIVGDFEAAGLDAGFVVIFDQGVGPKPPTPEMYEVDSASGTDLILKRLGMPSFIGQPPCPANAPRRPIVFRCNTVKDMIEAATAELKDRFSIAAADETDHAAILKRLTAEIVMCRLYFTMARPTQGKVMDTYWGKYKAMCEMACKSMEYLDKIYGIGQSDHQYLSGQFDLPAPLSPYAPPAAHVYGAYMLPSPYLESPWSPWSANFAWLTGHG